LLFTASQPKKTGDQTGSGLTRMRMLPCREDDDDFENEDETMRDDDGQ